MTNLTKFIKSRSAIAFMVILVIATTWPCDLFSNYQYANAFLLATTRVCFNSLSSSFQSECVFCNKLLYLQTLQSCIGQPTLPANITQDQAFCIATTCIHQTWRNPIVLGRRKRSIQLNVPLLGSLNKTSLTNGSLVLNNPLATVQNLFGLNRLPQTPFTLAWNYSNRSLSWRIGRDPAGTSAFATATSSASSASSPKAVAMSPAVSAPPAAAAPAPPKAAAPAPGSPPASPAPKPAGPAAAPGAGSPPAGPKPGAPAPAPVPAAPGASAGAPTGAKP